MCKWSLFADPLLTYRTILIIKLGEELLCSLILLTISVIWLSILIALVSVLGCQSAGLSRGGVGVRGLTSSLDSTTSGLSGTRPVALKLNKMLLFKIALLYTG